jgi:hypothetical protein
MVIRFMVEIQLDPAVIELEGKRRGYSLERARDTVIADVENRLSDGPRHRDGVDRVGVVLLKAPELQPN